MVRWVWAWGLVLGPGFSLKFEGVEGWGFCWGRGGGGCCGWFFSSQEDEGGGRMREGGGWGKVCLLGFWNGELRGEGGGEGDVCEVALIGLLGRWVEVFGRGGDMVGEKSARV